MTAQQVEFPSPPWVELYAPAITEVERRALLRANEALTPEDTWHHALTMHRALMIAELRRTLSTEKILNEGIIRNVLDTVWQLNMPILQRATGPMIAEAYISAFKKAKAGDVPVKMIYALAEEHARRTGEYFHGTSSDALMQGFNTYVNRQVPEKAAMERVLDAYGLTPRQMSGLTSNKQFETKVASSFPAKIKEKVKRYIGRSISARLKLFTRQEAHNLDQQAQQVAWMWMMQHEKLPKTTEKMWITARDEKVCAICGPLHRTKIPVRERFILEDGQKLYVPGAHPNCRCTVRLQIPVLELVGKADDPQFERQHPRSRSGRFVEVAEQQTDPNLELLLQEAKRLEEEERERARQQIEEIPEEPKGIQLPAKLSLPQGQGVNLPGGVSLPKTQGISLPTQTQKEPAKLPQLQRAQLEVSQTKPFELPSQFKTMELVSDWLDPVRLREELPEPIEDTDLVEGSRFFDVNGQSVRVYAVLDPDYGIKSGGNQVEIGPEDQLEEFESSVAKSKVSRQVAELFTQRIKDRTVGLMEQYGEMGSYAEFDQYGNLEGNALVPWGADDSGGTNYIEIPADKLKNIVSDFAHRNMVGNYHDATINLEHYDTELNPQGEEKMYISDVAEALGLDNSDFEVTVALMDLGHPNVEAINQRQNIFTSPGPYKIAGAMGVERARIMRPEDAPIPLNVIYVTPDVKTSRLTGKPFTPPTGL